MFCYFLEQSLKIYKKEQERYRFNSFSPWRNQNEVDFYIDGADYFENLAYSIELAKE